MKLLKIFIRAKDYKRIESLGSDCHYNILILILSHYSKIREDIFNSPKVQRLFKIVGQNNQQQETKKDTDIISYSDELFGHYIIYILSSEIRLPEYLWKRLSLVDIQILIRMHEVEQAKDERDDIYKRIGVQSLAHCTTEEDSKKTLRGLLEPLLNYIGMEYLATDQSLTEEIQRNVKEVEEELRQQGKTWDEAYGFDALFKQAQANKQQEKGV